MHFNVLQKLEKALDGFDVKLEELKELVSELEHLNQRLKQQTPDLNKEE